MTFRFDGRTVSDEEFVTMLLASRNVRLSDLDPKAGPRTKFVGQARMLASDYFEGPVNTCDIRVDLDQAAFPCPHRLRWKFILHDNDMDLTRAGHPLANFIRLFRIGEPRPSEIAWMSFWTDVEPATRIRTCIEVRRAWTQTFTNTRDISRPFSHLVFETLCAEITITEPMDAEDSGERLVRGATLPDFADWKARL